MPLPPTVLDLNHSSLMSKSFPSQQWPATEKITPERLRRRSRELNKDQSVLGEELRIQTLKWWLLQDGFSDVPCRPLRLDIWHLIND